MNEFLEESGIICSCIRVSNDVMKTDSSLGTALLGSPLMVAGWLPMVGPIFSATPMEHMNFSFPMFWNQVSLLFIGLLGTHVLMLWLARPSSHAQPGFGSKPSTTQNATAESGKGRFPQWDWVRRKHQMSSAFNWSWKLNISFYPWAWFLTWIMRRMSPVTSKVLPLQHSLSLPNFSGKFNIVFSSLRR